MKDKELREALFGMGILYKKDSILSSNMTDTLYSNNSYGFVQTTQSELGNIHKKLNTLLELLGVEEFDESKGLKKGNKKVEY